MCLNVDSWERRSYFMVRVLNVKVVLLVDVIFVFYLSNRTPYGRIKLFFISSCLEWRHQGMGVCLCGDRTITPRTITLRTISPRIITPDNHCDCPGNDCWGDCLGWLSRGFWFDWGDCPRVLDLIVLQPSMHLIQLTSGKSKLICFDSFF